MAPRISRFFSSHWGPVLTGTAVGLLAPLLVLAGNPGNMGICVVCFSRDIAGALGLHRAGLVQYIRPEIVGFVQGATLAALLFREFKARAGSAPSRHTGSSRAPVSVRRRGAFGDSSPGQYGSKGQ